jgi:hypothetical protein
MVGLLNYCVGFPTLPGKHKDQRWPDPVLEPRNDRNVGVSHTRWCPTCRWKDILEDIRKLQEKIKELVAWSNGKIGKGELGLDVSDLLDMASTNMIIYML